MLSVGYTLTDAFPSILNSSFPLTLTLSGPDVSLPVSVIQALKSGCATIEQLLQLSTFLLSSGAALEASHSGKIIFFQSGLHVITPIFHNPHSLSSSYRFVEDFLVFMCCRNVVSSLPLAL